MADRAKKISELTATTTAANTDKIIVLKDAANATAASTRSMTINALAQTLTPLVQAPIPNTTAIANSVVVASNGTSTVAFFSYSIGPGKTGCCDITMHARDDSTNSITAGMFVIVAYGDQANLNYTLTAEIGSNPIKFDNPPTVNVTSNTVTLYFRREASATSNVNIRYIATVF